MAVRSGDTPAACRRLGLIVQDGMERVDGVLARESALACGHLEQHRSEREEIRPAVDGVSADLFRRQVAGRPEQHARQRREGRRPRQGRPSVWRSRNQESWSRPIASERHCPVSNRGGPGRPHARPPDRRPLRRRSVQPPPPPAGRARVVRRVSPSRSSATRCGRPSSTPTSKTLTMFAWSSAAVTRLLQEPFDALRVVVPAWASSFSATSRCRRTSRA